MGYDRNLSRRFKSLVCITLTSFGMLLAPSAFGQVDEGSVTGVVQDATGAVVPGAKVTLLNTDQGLSQATTTDASGVYTFSPVRIGNYSLSATAPGFSVTTQQNVSGRERESFASILSLRPAPRRKPLRSPPLRPSCRPRMRQSGKWSTSGA